MSRRIATGTFWVGILVCAVLSFADVVRASWPPRPAPNLLGSWDGVFQADGTPGAISLAVNGQLQRSIRGNALLLEGGSAFNALEFAGTVVDDNYIAGLGRTMTGQLGFHADLETFAGRGGDAAVM